MHQSPYLLLSVGALLLAACSRVAPVPGTPATTSIPQTATVYEQLGPSLQSYPCPLASSQLADDFTVPENETWTFDQVDFYTHKIVEPKTFTVSIYADAAGSLGELLYTFSDRTSTVVEPKHQVSLDQVTLTAGTYWLRFFSDQNGCWQVSDDRTIGYEATQGGKRIPIYGYYTIPGPKPAPVGSIYVNFSLRNTEDAAPQNASYTIDAENVASLDGMLYGVRVGEGMSGPAHEGRVSVGGKRVINGTFRNGQSAKVLDVWGGNRIGVVPNKKADTLNPGGGQLQFVFAPFFDKELVTVKEMTIYNVIKPGLKVNLYQGKKLVRSVPVPMGGAGEPVKLMIDEPGISIVSLTARFPVAVDDLVFEVPKEQKEVVGQELLGMWEGEVHQSNYGNWTVNLNVKEDSASNKVVGEVAYPSLNCGGTWTLKNVDGNKFTFTEQISYGISNCVATSDVSVTHNEDDTLTYDWQYNGSSATGALYRPKPK